MSNYSLFCILNTFNFFFFETPNIIFRQVCARHTNSRKRPRTTKHRKHRI
ncbi:hypothetical protein MtrunA17_Chr4g0001821 [Medicago truncatula]|uniref:Uncharacterized protein n=1 Tax=Medicago truncatula TaxID=3880 RepID=A0A396I0M1_MEDTR|nr:hypothetical protein MtrunA17_Chr4g0001821 [Medicago truncatula]